jgi:hypothetical protein
LEKSRVMCLNFEGSSGRNVKRRIREGVREREV